MKLWEVEFWPRRIVTVEAEDEEGAFMEAITLQSGYPGSSECTPNGAAFRFWIREKKR